MAEASDAARKKADELGVDIEAVTGTGKDGNITVADVEAAFASQTTDPDNPTQREQEQSGSASEIAQGIEGGGKIPAVINPKASDATYVVEVANEMRRFTKTLPIGLTSADLADLAEDHRHGEEPMIVPIDSE